MSEETKDFVIKDRRAFSEESGPQTKETDEDRAGETSTGAASEKRKEDETRLPEINFPTFIMSLNASAMVNLGAIEDPVTGKKNIDLALAKQTIDILSLLEEKTTGNLAPEEAQMLKNILYDLRIAYVKQKE